MVNARRRPRRRRRGGCGRRARTTRPPPRPAAAARWRAAPSGSDDPDEEAAAGHGEASSPAGRCRPQRRGQRVAARRGTRRAARPTCGVVAARRRGTARRRTAANWLTQPPLSFRPLAATRSICAGAAVEPADAQPRRERLGERAQAQHGARRREAPQRGRRRLVVARARGRRRLRRRAARGRRPARRAAAAASPARQTPVGLWKVGTVYSRRTRYAGRARLVEPPFERVDVEAVARRTAAPRRRRGGRAGCPARGCRSAARPAPRRRAGRTA